MKRAAYFLCALLLVGATACQSYEPSLGSVRPHSRGDSSPETTLHARSFVQKDKTLRQLVALAYGSRTTPLADFLIADGPGWTATERFDIEVKTGDAHNTADFDSMLQAFLAQKFRLKAHRENRQLPDYELVVSTPGKINRSERGKSPQGRLGPFDFGIRGIHVEASRFLLGSPRVSAQRFAYLLQQYLDHPVVDKTDLHGLFDMRVDVAGFTTRDPTTDPVFENLQSQLGLQLRPSKGPFEVIVIDVAEQPRDDGDINAGVRP